MLDSNETVSLIVDQNIAAGSVSGSIPNKRPAANQAIKKRKGG